MGSATKAILPSPAAPTSTSSTTGHTAWAGSVVCMAPAEALPDAEAPDAVAAFAASPVVLCGAQPESPAKAARPAVAAAPVKNERRLSALLSGWFMVPPLID